MFLTLDIKSLNRLHSKREIFRYDENITFAQKELLPCIEAYRDAHARGERYPGASAFFCPFPLHSFLVMI